MAGDGVLICSIDNLPAQLPREATDYFGKLLLPWLQEMVSEQSTYPLKFASLPTCGFVAQLVERPTSIWEARVQAPSKPEFFSGFFFCNFFNCSLPARINSLLKYILSAFFGEYFEVDCSYNSTVPSPG